MFSWFGRLFGIGGEKGTEERAKGAEEEGDGEMESGASVVVVPMAEPAKAVSSGAVLAGIRCVGEHRMRTVPSGASVEGLIANGISNGVPLEGAAHCVPQTSALELEGLSLDYDVFKPKASFKKSAPGNADCAIVVTKYTLTKVRALCNSNSFTLFSGLLTLRHPLRPSLHLWP